MAHEKRQFDRRELEDISAKLFRANTTDEIDFCPINVSQEGFSIYTSRQLAVGEKLFLALEAKDVPLSVKWCRSMENDLAVFRCGLQTQDPLDHLDELIKEELSY